MVATGDGAGRMYSIRMPSKFIGNDRITGYFSSDNSKGCWDLFDMQLALHRNCLAITALFGLQSIKAHTAQLL